MPAQLSQIRERTEPRLNEKTGSHRALYWPPTKTVQGAPAPRSVFEVTPEEQATPELTALLAISAVRKRSLKAPVRLPVSQQTTFQFRRLFRLLRAVCAVGLINASAASAQPAAGQAPPDPTGEWLVAKQIARIRIADCGDGHLWGVVAWEAQPGGIDSKNPNPDLRSRPTLGMPILLNMEQEKNNRWNGQVYNSEDGHTYSATITLVNPDTLRVQGCFLGILCGGENWSRYVELPTPAKPEQKSKTTREAAPGRYSPNADNPKPIQASDDVCLSVFGPTWLSHERRLK